MKQIVFLLEEESMKALLDNLLPRLLPAEINFLCIPHEGKQDLEKSIPRKLKAWQCSETSFVVIRDQDRADCVDVKNRLVRLCSDAGRPDSLVRIACHELESWFLGDLIAVENAFNIKKLAIQQQKSTFKDPDKLTNAKEELKKLVKSYQTVSGAKLIGPHMSLKNNQSHSFNCFIDGIYKMIKHNFVS